MAIAKTSITGILEAYGEAILRARIVALTNFAVMVDECIDVNGVEKVSICIRFLEQKGAVKMFLRYWSIESTKAGSIHRCIVTSLAKFGLGPDHLCAASFDGASNMSGHRSGVQTLLKKTLPELWFASSTITLFFIMLKVYRSPLPGFLISGTSERKISLLFRHGWVFAWTWASNFECYKCYGKLSFKNQIRYLNRKAHSSDRTNFGFGFGDESCHMNIGALYKW